MTFVVTSSPTPLDDRDASRACLLPAWPPAGLPDWLPPVMLEESQGGPTTQPAAIMFTQTQKKHKAQNTNHVW